MERTATATGSLLDLGTRPLAEFDDPQRAHPPIYASLVAEWRARGRTVPGQDESPCAVPATPPGDDVTLADSGRWERVPVGRAEPVGAPT
ncbi:hypothetical protein ACIP79_39340 [Streptomyces sp. NPDC088747]|uniref:hypothetical protein n=1 Tax=Streptomyces sp. NPDC088747 TaxID=3365886 RepID=UPI0037F6ADAF